MKILTPVLLLSLALMLIVSGCGKDDTTTPPEAPDAGQTTTKAPDLASGFTMDVDLQKSLDALKAEAAKMSVDKLEAVAKKYQAELMKKEAQLKETMEKLSAIPMMEKMGTEAQELTKEMQTIGEAVKAIGERFEVYYEAFQAKGGDMSKLKVE